MPSTDGDAFVVVVFGRPGAGKTALVAHLSLHLSPLPSLPPPSALPPTPQHPHTPAESPGHTPARAPPPLFVRHARAAWAAAAQRVRRRLHRPVGPPYATRALPAPAGVSGGGGGGGRSWLVVDVQEAGLYAAAYNWRPDVVLYVSRLDETRAEKADRVLLTEMGRAFGRRVWARTVFVLTRGCALPPAALTYAEFLRGRRDALWRDMTMILPPVPRREAAGDASDGSSRGGSDGDSSGGGDGDDDEDEGGAAAAVRGRERLEAGARRAAAPDVVRDAAGGGGDGATEVQYDDPPAPEIAVVELADACPRSQRGEKLLSDGTPWMRGLIATIDRVVLAAEEAGAGGGAADDESDEDARGVYRDPKNEWTFRDVLWHMARRGSWVLAGELVLIFVLVNTIEKVSSYREARDKRIRSGRSDTVLQLSDAEYRRLTATDGQPESAKQPGGLEEADKFFFGSGATKPSPPDPPSSSAN